MSYTLEDVTGLLIQWREGARSAMDRLIPIVYDKPHRIAGRYSRRELADNTVQPTALVNEVYIRRSDRHIAGDRQARVGAGEVGGCSRSLSLVAISRAE